MKVETLAVSYKAAKCHPIVLRFSHGTSRIVKISKSLFIYLFFIAFLLNLKRFSQFLGAPLRECKCISSLEQNETNKEAATAEVREL